MPNHHCTLNRNAPTSTQARTPKARPIRANSRAPRLGLPPCQLSLRQKGQWFVAGAYPLKLRLNVVLGIIALPQSWQVTVECRTLSHLSSFSMSLWCTTDNKSQLSLRTAPIHLVTNRQVSHGGGNCKARPEMAKYWLFHDALWTLWDDLAASAVQDLGTICTTAMGSNNFRDHGLPTPTPRANRKQKFLCRPAPQ